MSGALGGIFFDSHCTCIGEALSYCLNTTLQMVKWVVKICYV